MDDLISRQDLLEQLNCINLPVGVEEVDRIFDVIEKMPSVNLLLDHRRISAYERSD